MDTSAPYSVGFTVSKKGTGPVTVDSFTSSTTDTRFNIHVGDILLSINGKDTSTYTLQQVRTALGKIHPQNQQSALVFCSPAAYTVQIQEQKRQDRQERNRAAIAARAEVSQRAETDLQNRAQRICGFSVSKQPGRNNPFQVTAVTAAAARSLRIEVGSVFMSIGNNEVSSMTKTELDTVLCTLTNSQLLSLRFCSMDEFQAHHVQQERNRRANVSRTRHVCFQPIPQEWDYEHPCPHCGFVYLVSDVKAVRSQCCLNGKALTAEFPQLLPVTDLIEFLGTMRTAHMNANCSFYNGALQLGMSMLHNNIV